jgi:oligopeptidase B
VSPCTPCDLSVCRGGGELGRRHHEQGKGSLKWNTFRDYEACAAHLIATRLTAPDLLCGSFGSAGGLIGGVLVNRFPELFRALIMRLVLLPFSLPSTALP